MGGQSRLLPTAPACDGLANEGRGGADVQGHGGRRCLDLPRGLYRRDRGSVYGPDADSRTANYRDPTACTNAGGSIVKATQGPQHRPLPWQSGNTPDSIVAAFKAAGLDLESPASIDRTAYEPILCTGKQLLIPSVGADGVGRVYVCANGVDQSNFGWYYTGQASVGRFSWVFENGDVLVWLDGQVPEAMATRYEAAIPLTSDGTP